MAVPPPEAPAAPRAVSRPSVSRSRTRVNAGRDARGTSRAKGARLGLGGAVLVALLAGAAGALLSAGAHAGGVAFSGRVAAGCDTLAECRSLEADAERRAGQCLLFCGREEAEHRAARLMRYRAEERQAVREHYRARELAEEQQQERVRARALDEQQRRDSARAEQAAREQHERVELEQLRQSYLDRRLAEERQRKLSYFVALGAEGRAQRLGSCLERRERCDVLALDLLDAAHDDAERRALAQLNERMTQAPSTAPSTSGEPPAASSPVAKDERRAASERRATGAEGLHAPAVAEQGGADAAPAADAADGTEATPPRLLEPASASVPSS